MPQLHAISFCRLLSRVLQGTPLPRPSPSMSASLLYLGTRGREENRAEHRSLHEDVAAWRSKLSNRFKFHVELYKALMDRREVLVVLLHWL